jgi:hypothetical protein
MAEDGTGWLVGLLFLGMLALSLYLIIVGARIKEQQKKEAAMMKYFEKE